ncbi:MAG TPA: RDD family protein [Baekduia sp.]|uniref:RDD family protein n=1 Tax=Baekduia sp. TaxID=2600305 RepID=UPI002C0D47B9|nr:RDD family protein [Baekduia sp.]HMJ35752.1 RDD family protein [Baekduia sp.]
MEDYQDRLRIATPEGLSVDLVLAGVGSRFFATLIDLTFKIALIVAVTLLAAQIGDLGIAVVSILGFAVYFAYDVAFEVLCGGRTPGKRWTGLRVLRDDGRPVDLLSSAIRNVVRLVDGLPLSYLPAMISILLTQRNQRLGDLAASTIVVREPRRPASMSVAGLERAAAGAPALAVAAAAPTFGGFGLPPGVGDLSPVRRTVAAGDVLDVSAVTADDLAAVRGFLDRRDDLPPEVRGDLARRIAGALAPRVGGAAAHLGDEDLIERVAHAKARGE